MRIYGLSREQDTRWGQAHGPIAEWWKKAAPDEFTIVLGHHPNYVMKVTDVPIDLCLAGHTHGGQIVLPGLGALVVPSRLGRKRASGLFREEGSQLFITRGVGEIFPPLRLGCPPEIALLVLRRAEAEG